MGGFGGQRNRVPVLFLFVVGVEVFAGIAMGAIGASVVSITDAIFRRQLVAVLGLGDRLDCVVREYFEFAIDVLRGDPKARQEEACAAGVQFRGAERAENPREGNLDGAACGGSYYRPRAKIFSGDKDACPRRFIVRNSTTCYHLFLIRAC